MVARIEIHAVADSGFDLISGQTNIRFNRNRMFIPFVNGAVRWVASRVDLKDVSLVQVSWRTASGVYRSFTIDPRRNVVSFPAVN